MLTTAHYSSFPLKMGLEKTDEGRKGERVAGRSAQRVTTETKKDEQSFNRKLANDSYPSGEKTSEESGRKAGSLHPPFPIPVSPIKVKCQTRIKIKKSETGIKNIKM